MKLLFNIFVRFAIILLPIFLFFGIYLDAIEDIYSREAIFFPLLVIWLLTAFVFLPRIHRLLSSLYSPQYFIGRARSTDGFLADPINLAIIGSMDQLTQMMEDIGWKKVDKLTLKSGIRMGYAIIFRKPYPTAPDNELLLFNKPSSISFQLQPTNHPRNRYHVRFWDVDKFHTPSGELVDFLGAIHQDHKIGFSAFKLMVDHKIDKDVDKMRNKLIDDIKKYKVKSHTKLDHFTPYFKDRNNGSTRIFSDGKIAIITLK